MRRLLQLSLVVTLSIVVHAQTSKQPDENAALRYWNAFAQMRDQQLTDAQSKQLEDIANGNAAWDESTFGRLLDENRSAVETMVRGTSFPYCVWGIDYKLADAAPIPQVGRGRVLARLNAITAQRLAAQGKSREATDHLIAGLRFSRDLSAGMPVIGALVGKLALSDDLNTAALLIKTGKLSNEDRQRLNGAVRALPVDVFNWGSSIRIESEAIQGTLRKLQVAPDPAKLLEAWGMHEAAKNPRPSPQDIPEVARLMNDAEALFRQSLEVNRGGLSNLVTRIGQLPPVASQQIPSFQRLYDRRKEVVELRQKILDLQMP
jgi:hypothetical protein